MPGGGGCFEGDAGPGQLLLEFQFFDRPLGPVILRRLLGEDVGIALLHGDAGHLDDLSQGGQGPFGVRDLVIQGADVFKGGGDVRSGLEDPGS